MKYRMQPFFVQCWLQCRKQSFVLAAVAAVIYVAAGAAPAATPAPSPAPAATPAPSPAPAATTNDAPRVTRSMLIDLEKSLDSRVAHLSQDNPFVLLGPTRGIYLDGYGAVFTAEINLVSSSGALGMFRPQISKDEVEQHRQKKLARIPQLRLAMRQALLDSAASLDTEPPQEQIVVVALLSKYPWEDITGVPSRS